MKNSDSKIYKIVSNSILICIIIAAFIVIFDEDYTNDFIGWFLIIVFWTVKSIINYRINIKKGNTKIAMADLLLVGIALSFLITRVI
ncbi:hypothetical protein LS684_16395 [Cytobacillus spongiae]|jgi:hypothetical protein|uniref:hypothetical protein n=1 Tax=Cytobacillus spongiae TaxID=2901381 RepID=UPI001F380D9E|nr:hypothetical protein [Cytobacillus spongiae]UII55218.1 hypothetical protein LS684_16395 [Cytobacillus spongiae]